MGDFTKRPGKAHMNLIRAAERVESRERTQIEEDERYFRHRPDLNRAAQYRDADGHEITPER